MPAPLRHLMLATLEDTNNPLAWSGTAMAVRQALAGAVEKLTVLDNLPVKRSPLHAAVRIAAGGKPARYPLWMTKPALREFARRTAEAVEREQPQALLSISSQCLVYLPEFLKSPPLPIFLFSDSAWMAWLEVYKGYYPAPLGAKRFANRERLAARQATRLIYGSEWAKADAVWRFGVAPERVAVQPLGASWQPLEDEGAVEAAVHARPADRLDLVFLSKEWERKGGPLALEIARGLQASGRVGPVTLHVVGGPPAIAPGDASLVRIHRMLRRSIPEEAARLRELLLRSHFLVVPTLAECFGLVFAEAQAFALPPVSRAVDAVPSVVIDGETGILQPKEDGPEPYIRRMLALLENGREAYARMALAGRARFHEKLNWPAFGRGVRQVIESVVS